MRHLVIGLAVLSVTGCSLGSSLMRDITSKAPAFCSSADIDEAKQAAAAVLMQMPEGTDKEKAKQAIAAASFSAELVCNAVKVIEAAKKS